MTEQTVRGTSAALSTAPCGSPGELGTTSSFTTVIGVPCAVDCKAMSSATWVISWAIVELAALAVSVVTRPGATSSAP